MKRKVLRILLMVLLGLFVHDVIVLFPAISPIHHFAYAQDWKKEFEDICSKTDNAMSLSKEELKTLIGRCDNLRLIVEKQEETEKKVYLKRLSLCRDLFAFVLESKEKE